MLWLYPYLECVSAFGLKGKVPWKHQMISFLFIHYIDRRPNQSFPRDYSAKNVSKSIFLRFSCRFRYNDTMSTTSWVHMVLLCKSSQSLLVAKIDDWYFFSASTGGRTTQRHVTTKRNLFVWLRLTVVYSTSTHVPYHPGTVQYELWAFPNCRLFLYHKRHHQRKQPRDTTSSIFYDLDIVPAQLLSFSFKFCFLMLDHVWSCLIVWKKVFPCLSLACVPTSGS